MPTQVVVHSTAKRFLQVILATLLLAAALTGLKRWAAYTREGPTALSEETPVTLSDPAATTAASPNASIIVGVSSVVDGDTIDIHGRRIRLEGIDAPESGQRCDASGSQWPCGQQAALALSDWLGQRSITCRPRGTDRYGRMLARCFVGADDVQAWLVSHGWALAYREYSQDYVAAEEHASLSKSGVWQGAFEKPWDWRKKAP